MSVDVSTQSFDLVDAGHCTVSQFIHCVIERGSLADRHVARAFGKAPIEVDAASVNSGVNDLDMSLERREMGQMRVRPDGAAATSVLGAIGDKAGEPFGIKQPMQALVTLLVFPLFLRACHLPHQLHAFAVFLVFDTERSAQPGQFRRISIRQR